MPKQKVSDKFIIKQSLLVFRKKGFYNTSMADIAEACGLLKGSLYHYFKSKEDLMKAVIDYMHNYYTREIFSLAYDEQLGMRQKLKMLADASENQFFASESGCLFGNLALETSGNIPEFSELVKLFFVEWMKAMEHIYAEKYAPEKARILAQDCVARVEGAVMMMRLFNDKEYLRRAHLEIMNQLE
ncbi:TetR/AcrR family transcriptional regulator [Sphingobacteriales bacterium UPWRP_1]|nr:hypothetical protein B6N25_06600 [Sphingobacteriales bacterium TSM_CSS]PSJ75490.1 TetR/AcrR family transcriptional regulator [Sphingobacteriales bacterium UPWRP_1]